MEQRGASRSTLNTQMNLWMVLSLLAALAAIFGLGSWTIFRIAPDFATAPQDASLSLWIATVVAALGAVIVVAFSWLRMRAGLRQRMLELAETLRQVASGDRLGARADRRSRRTRDSQRLGERHA